MTIQHSSSTIAAIRAEVIRQANVRHIRYPQYRGHWDGSEWRVIRVKRTIRTKMGEAFQAGALTLAKQEDAEIAAFNRPGQQFVTAYSCTNGIDTSISIRDIEWLEGSN